MIFADIDMQGSNILLIFYGLVEEGTGKVYASENVRGSIHIPSHSASGLMEPPFLSSLSAVHHVEETQYPGALSQATRVPYPNTDRISPRAETCVPSLSILDMSIGDADSSPIPRSPKDIGDAMASHHCPHIEKTVNTQMGRNSLESLAELERLIEEQHRELVARGILPADDDILDTSVQAEVDSDAKSFSRHLSAIRKVACGDQDSLQFTQNRDESDQIEFSRFRTGQSANIADADGFPSNVSGCFEAQGYQQIPDSIRKLSEIGKKFNQGGDKHRPVYFSMIRPYMGHSYFLTAISEYPFKHTLESGSLSNHSSTVNFNQMAHISAWFNELPIT